MRIVEPKTDSSLPAWALALTCDECKATNLAQAVQLEVDLGGYHHYHNLCPACVADANSLIFSEKG